MGDRTGDDGAISRKGFRSIVRGALLLSLVLALGTSGYMAIEGWPLLEGLYMELGDAAVTYQCAIEPCHRYPPM